MVKVYIEIPYERYAKLEEIRAKSKYPTIQSVIIVAVDNLIAVEEQTFLERPSLKEGPPPSFAVGKADVEKLPHASVLQAVERQGRSIGLWVMTNTFLPMKIGVRVLTQHNGGPVPYYDFLDECFKKAQSLREFLPKDFRAGLPAEDAKNSRGRLDWHFLREAHVLGLLAIFEDASGKNVAQLTKEGCIFAKLPNPCLDGTEPRSVLSQEEREWLRQHLKKIDAEKMKEFAWMQRVASFIESEKNTTRKLIDAVATDPLFESYVKSWSKKAEDAKALTKQKQNLAQASYGSTLRLMTELGLAKRVKRGLFRVTDEGRKYFNLSVCANGGGSKNA